MPKLERRVG